MLERKNISDFSPIRIGGVVNHFREVFCEEDLKKALSWADSNNRRVKVFSRASNILFANKVFNELFIKISIDFFYSDNSIAVIGAGRKVSSVMNDLLKRQLSGLEFLAGIPGSMGGCIKNNSSAGQGSMKDVLVYIKAVDLKGNTFLLRNDDLCFDYRRTDIPHEAVIVEAGFRLKKCKKEEVKKKIKQILRHRRETQPVGKRSLGCVFRNPDQSQSAGSLIERAGLKGLRRGGVRINDRHANFFEVEEGALFKDFYFLMGAVKNIVKDKFGVELEPEIQIWKY